jgi:hypothetical protein
MQRIHITAELFRAIVEFQIAYKMLSGHDITFEDVLEIALYHAKKNYHNSGNYQRQLVHNTCKRKRNFVHIRCAVVCSNPEKSSRTFHTSRKAKAGEGCKKRIGLLFVTVTSARAVSKDAALFFFAVSALRQMCRKLHQSGVL